MKNLLKKSLLFIVITFLFSSIIIFAQTKEVDALTTSVQSSENKIFTGVVIDIPSLNVYVCNFSGTYFVIEDELLYNIGEEVSVLVDKDGVPLNIYDYNYNFDEIL